MRLLIVSRLDRSARAINTIASYVRVGKTLGHEVAVFGEPRGDSPEIPTTLSVSNYDFAIFVVYETPDFPDLPYLAQLLDHIPRERRVLIDCTGRYNETIQVEHDFNHLEIMDNHQGWEWVDGFQAVAKTILQPTLTPLRSDVRSFLFHGFDPAAVVARHASAEEAAQHWAAKEGKSYGMVYVGNNWQRWSQMRSLLTAIEPIRQDLGPVCLAGWAWDQRPDWAAELGIRGIDTDPALLEQLGVELKFNIPYAEVNDLVSRGLFSPVIHRPLFNHLGLVTNRTFETFCSDTIPLLMLPAEMVEAIYGPAACPLAPGDDVAGHLQDMMRRPAFYWDAVLKTRAHLAARHSFQTRVAELLEILAC